MAKRNEKTKIKRQIPDEYEKSAKYMRAYLVNFMSNTTILFRTHTNIKDDTREHEFLVLQKNIDIVEFSASKLISSLRLYYQNEEMVIGYREILSHLSEMNMVVSNTAYAKKSNKAYVENIANFSKLEQELQKKLLKFEMKLIKLPLHKDVI